MPSEQNTGVKPSGVFAANAASSASLMSAMSFCVIPRISFPLRLQPQLYKPADGLGASGTLRFRPIHDLLHQSVGYSNAIKRLRARCGTAGLFTFNGY